MISIRLFFVFSFVLFNSAISLIYGSEFRKECMPGKALTDLRQQHDDQLRSFQTDTDYQKFMYLSSKVNGLRYLYQNADYKDTLKDLKELQTRIDKSEKKLDQTAHEFKKAHKDFFALRECIREREFAQLPLK